MTVSLASINEYSIFDRIAVKVVTATDVSRGAYVLSKDQVNVLAAAGRMPLHDDHFTVKVAFDRQRISAQASYYESARGAEAGRRPEPRMGREVVTSWMRLGDAVAIANVGRDILVFKMADCPADMEKFIIEIAPLVTSQVVERAEFDKPTEQRVVQQAVYVRSPWVVASALLRADGSCEMPRCEEVLIIRDDGKPYLEVHHIDPLSNGGPDILSNVAALCPRCHRFLHFGQGRAAAAECLADAIRNKMGVVA